MTPNRKKRPELERSEPIRNWSGMFGEPGRSGARGQAAPPPERGAQHAAEPIARGVDLGYRVIEQYLQQGQAFARGVSPAARGGGGFGAVDPQRLTEQLARTTFDLAATWLDLWSASGARGASRGVAGVSAAPPSPADVEPVGAFEIEGSGARPPRAAGQPAPQRSHWTASGSAGAGSTVAAPLGATQPAAKAAELVAPLTSVDVRSSVRTEVTLDLKPGSAALRLFAHDLRALDAGLPRIAGVVLESFSGDNRVLVRVRVPDAQPAATYTGLILDEATHLPRGSLTVRVYDECS
jgi:hypothetical protein